MKFDIFPGKNFAKWWNGNVDVWRYTKWYVLKYGMIFSLSFCMAKLDLTAFRTLWCIVLLPSHIVAAGGLDYDTSLTGNWKVLELKLCVFAMCQKFVVHREYVISLFHAARWLQIPRSNRIFFEAYKQLHCSACLDYGALYHPCYRLRSIRIVMMPNDKANTKPNILFRYNNLIWCNCKDWIIYHFLFRVLQDLVIFTSVPTNFELSDGFKCS